ncbi:MAG: 5'/3'-nucleotidase SurE [Phycisphaerae bacterium]|nr:5'/3'-nucleotidase SurE [Phycisphaerae bacterium]
MNEDQLTYCRKPLTILRMEILLTNDDGIFAPGIAAIYKVLRQLGNVTVVAPADSMSGASHSITYKDPLSCSKVDIKGRFSGYSVHGSPADCVKLAYMQLHKKNFDLLVSGINAGANAGINVYYSGTVAAAMEGAFLRIPSIAVSLAFEDNMDFDAAAEHAIRIIRKLLPLKTGDVVNINIPHLSRGEPKGVKVVPQATEGYHEYYIEKTAENGQTVYQLTGGEHRSGELPVDICELVDGYITVTALIPDMTNHKRTVELGKISWK